MGHRRLRLELATWSGWSYSQAQEHAAEEAQAERRFGKSAQLKQQRLVLYFETDSNPVYSFSAVLKDLAATSLASRRWTGPCSRGPCSTVVEEVAMCVSLSLVIVISVDPFLRRDDKLGIN